MTLQRPPLSTVIASTHPGEQLGIAVRTVAEQMRAVGGELILATSAHSEVRARLGTEEGIEVLELPSANLLELRAAGISAARGETIALTEDHVVVDSEWAAATLRAHDRNPAAAVIGGAVENGSRRWLIDWANFLMTFGPFLPPITAERHHRMPVIANASIKRAAISGTLRPGEFEFELLPRLAVERRVAFDHEPLVWHVQSHGLAATMYAHFHNGRMTAGFSTAGRPWHERRQRTGAKRLRTLADDALATVSERQLPSRARASVPLALVLCASHVAGEIVGTAFGPGKSAERLA